MKQTKLFLYASYVLLLICVVLIVIYGVVLYFGEDCECIFSFLLAPLKANFGDIIAGTVGILLSFASTLFLFITFKEQRKQFELSETSHKIASFEDTFFNIMSLLSDVRRTTIESLKNHDINSIEGYYYKYVSYFIAVKKSSIVEEYFKELASDNTIDSVVDAAKHEVGLCYKEFVDKAEGNIGYFFRYTSNPQPY